MVRGIEISIVSRYNVGYILRMIVPSTTFINERADRVSSPPIEGGSIKESGVRVPL